LWPECVPTPQTPRPIDLASRPGAIELLSAWRSYSIDRDSSVLSRQDRAVIASAVAVRLGDATVTPVGPRTRLQTELVELADIVTLAPWKLGPAAFAPLRAAGLAEDAEVFDAVATASSCTVFSRIEVALAALAR